MDKLNDITKLLAKYHIVNDALAIEIAIFVVESEKEQIRKDYEVVTA